MKKCDVSIDGLGHYNHSSPRKINPPQDKSLREHIQFTVNKIDVIIAVRPDGFLAPRQYVILKRAEFDSIMNAYKEIANEAE